MENDCDDIIKELDWGVEFVVQDLGTGVSHFLTLPTCFWVTSLNELQRMCDIFNKILKRLFYVRKLV